MIVTYPPRSSMNARPSPLSAPSPHESALRVRPVISFEAFYQAHYARLLGLGIALTGNRMVAEDLVHDAFTEAHRRWESVAEYDYPEAWLRRVFINKSHSRGRRMLSEARMIAKVRTRRIEPIMDIELPGRSSDAWHAVRRLPRRQAEAITLHYWEDLTVAQIADTLEVGEESVKTHLKRGRAKLAELLEDSIREPDNG